MIEQLKGLCPQCSNCTAETIPSEGYFTRNKPKPTPNFTAGVSDVARLSENTQQGEERVILDPIAQFTQAVELGFTPVGNLTDIFGGQTTQYANGAEFTWSQEMQRR